MRVKPCPQCGETPSIGYSCGEHFVYSNQITGLCVCSSFYEMHASKISEITAWNNYVDNYVRKRGINK